MNKKEFKELISKNKDIFVCVALIDATIRTGYPHCAVVIYWRTSIDHTTTVKTMRGKDTDLKNIDVLNKYISWLD